jgi:adenosylcobinamide kinase/adenosylcobinamide-phosphate guanylyltransferase
MAALILITGGCRSGKSDFAQRLAENIPGSRIYLATAPCLDEEMAQRIARHRAAREATGWQTIEETLDIAGVLDKLDKKEIVLVDCLTLWINNLLFEAEKAGTELTEEAIADKCREIADACKKRSGTTLCVANEVGLGIVPDNALARRFRDLAGRCNQTFAAAADTAVFMVSGIPLCIKGELGGIRKSP